MEAETGSQHGPAVAIVAGIVDMLNIDARENSAPYMGVVVALDDIFAAVIQGAVAQQKSQTSQREIVLVVGGDAIRNKNRANFVLLRDASAVSCQVGADLDGLVDFGVGVGLMLSFVPSPAQEAANQWRAVLLQVDRRSRT